VGVGKVRSITGNTFHSWKILVKQKFWVRVLVVLWCISLLAVDDLVEDETKLKMLKNGVGFLRDLIRNIISLSSYEYIRGSR